jgi:HlyD family type I secretion membrane fusion protein
MSNEHAKDAVTAPPPASGDWRRPLKMGLLISVVGVGGFVGWAVAAPLDSAVVASGIVAVEGSRQTVQHLEGGIIKEILVRDGQLVQKGDLLFVLDDTAQKATLAALTTERAIREAQETRLTAERDNAPELTFPQRLRSNASPAVQKALADELSSFTRRRDLRDVQDSVLVNKKDTLRQEMEGLRAERQSSEEQIAQIDRELSGLKGLLDRGLTSLNRVTTLERDRSALQATAARAITDSAKAERMIGEADLEIAQQRADWQSKVAGELIEVRRLMAETDERVNIARDVLTRLNVYAPQTGVAQARGPSTIGAVVKPGDSLVEIAPIDENLIINAKVMPNDVDVINVNQNAEIRFPNFKAGEQPLMYGRVQALSNDRITDPQDPRIEYFYARVEIDRKEIEAIGDDRVRAGMTAEVIFPTGERTAGEYLMQPITDRLRIAFRER